MYTVVCTYINDNNVLSPVLISPYSTLGALLSHALRGKFQCKNGLFRAVALENADVPTDIDLWLRGYDNIPKPEKGFDIMESCKYNVIHPYGVDGKTLVFEPKE